MVDIRWVEVDAIGASALSDLAEHCCTSKIRGTVIANSIGVPIFPTTTDVRPVKPVKPVKPKI